MDSHMTTLDFVVLAVYFALAMGVGFYFYRRTRSRDGFTAASRSLPGVVTGLSILATYLSSISFLALPGKAYATNWNAFVFSLSLPVTAWIAARWVVPYYRNSMEVSAYSHLEHRFGPWARLYASICYLLTQLARIGTVMYLMALPLHVLLGWDIRWIILVTGLCVTLYSFVGGIVAVIWNDAIQAVVLSHRGDRLPRPDDVRPARGAGAALRGRQRPRQVQPRQLRRQPRRAHVLGGVHLRDRHQPAELLHRSELRPALHRLQLPPGGAEEPLGGGPLVPPALRALLHDRHRDVRLLHDAAGAPARRVPRGRARPTRCCRTSSRPSSPRASGGC